MMVLISLMSATGSVIRLGTHLRVTGKEWINITMACSIRDLITEKIFFLSSISPLFVDRFGRSLRFCHIEFGKEAIANGGKAENNEIISV